MRRHRGIAVVLAGFLAVTLTPASAAREPGVAAGRVMEMSAIATPGMTPTTVAATATVVGDKAGVTVIKTREGSWRAFAIGADGAVRQQYQTASGWSAPESLGGSFLAGPAVVYRATDHHFDLFAVDAAGRMLQRTFAGSWGGWTDTGVRGLRGQVAAVRDTAGAMHVFGVDAARQVTQVIYAGKGWGGLQRLGLVAKGNVAVVYTPSHRRYDLFVVDSAGRIQQKYYTGTAWSSWQVVSKNGFTGGVTAVRLADRQYRVFGRGTNGQLYQVAFSSRWMAPQRLGGNLIGVPGSAWSGNSGLVIVSGADGRLHSRNVGQACCSSTVLPGAGYPLPVLTRTDLANRLIARWGGRLTGNSGVLADLRATADGRPISYCGSVHLDTMVLTVLNRVTDKYQVHVSSLVSGHSCDSGQHPLGRAIDFNTIVDPATGRRTNWHTGASGDNQALDAEFLTYAAAAIVSGGGAGQRNCAGSARATLPAGMLRFDDTCTHQHLDVRPKTW